MNLYETHIPVSDLANSIKFYGEVVGLELALEQPHRSVAFMWIGSREQGMLGLWGPESLYGWKEGQRFKSHLAIALPLKELLETPARLQSLGIKTRGANEDVAHEPSVIGWMPSAQVYFSDPDGHSLEYITILDQEPFPNFEGTWSEWCNKLEERI